MGASEKTEHKGGQVTALTRICEDALLAVGYELVELEHLREPHGWVLRVYIEHALDSSGDADAERPPIRHADCVEVSRHLGTVLDVEDPVEGAYRLEVSSPGVQRPLRKQQDFERFVGQRVKVAMAELVEGSKNFTGVLTGVESGAIGVDVDGRAVSLPMEGIRKARLDVALPGPSRPKQGVGPGQPSHTVGSREVEKD